MKQCGFLTREQLASQQQPEPREALGKSRLLEAARFMKATLTEMRGRSQLLKCAFYLTCVAAPHYQATTHPHHDLEELAPISFAYCVPQLRHLRGSAWCSLSSDSECFC